MAFDAAPTDDVVIELDTENNPVDRLYWNLACHMADLQKLEENLKEHLQANLEFDMKNAGVQAYLTEIHEAKGKTESTTDYGARLLRETVQTAAARIADELKAVFTGRPGVKALAAVKCKDMDPRVLAYLTGKALVDAVSSRRPLTKAAVAVGGMVEDEQRMTKFASANKGAFDWTMRRVAATTSREHRRGVSRHLMKLKDVPWHSWGQREKLQVGIWLINLFNEATGLFTLELVRQGDQTTYYVEAAPGTLEWINKAAKHGEMLATEHWPTIIPPKQWRRPWSGGYHTPLVPRLSLVKVKGHKGARAYLEELRNMDMTRIYDAVNAVQETAWRVNTPVMAALERVVAESLAVRKMPPGADLEIPPKPVDIETNADARKWWKKAASIVRGKNAKARSRRIQVARTLDMAQRFSKYPEFFFPHTLDFRGRMYALPAFLNPQGPDYAKALLTFAEGKPIETEEQVEWLAVHGANSFGVDKASFADRYNWVVDNDAKIRAVAADPFASNAFDFWSTADAPFQFLAFCYEWAALMAHGYGYVSSLPVSLDGSCNGLQHYSAALRDPIGGAAVNLLPSDKPQDIYETVAKVVVGKVERMKNLSGDEGRFARAWLVFGINRKITKRSVMTLPYGCTKFSVRAFVEEAVRDAIDNDGRDNAFAFIDDKGERRDGIFEATRFLQDLVWDAIGEVVVAAREAMDWLQASARVIAKEGLPIVWTTPDGFPVQQAYVETVTRDVKTKLDGRTRLKVQEDSHTMDSRRQAQGIAPNWVHSMDAAALRVFVRLARDNGVCSFSLVHDSYGAVAADVPMVAAALREAFVMLYEDRHALQVFRDEVSVPLTDKALAQLPPAPTMGILDLSEVRSSPYFFA